MKLLVDIPKKINTELKRYKLDNNLRNIQESVNLILADKFNIELKGGSDKNGE